MDEHFLVMTENDLELRLEGRVGNLAPALEPLDNLADEPWPSVAPTADHQSVGAGFPQCTIGVVQGDDVAVCDNRNSDGFLDLANEFPIGGSGIKLAARAAVHADHANAARFS